MKKKVVTTYEISAHEKSIIDSLLKSVSEFTLNKSTKSLEQMKAASSIVESIFREYGEVNDEEYYNKELERVNAERELTLNEIIESTYK